MTTGPAMFNDPPVRTEAMLTLFRTVQRRLLLLTAAAAVLGAGIGMLVSGLSGVWGALIAATLGLLFTLTTVALLRLVAGRGPEILQLVLIGGWIVKMVLVVIVMLWLRQQDFYDRGVFFGTLVVVVLGAVVIEIVSVATSRIPYAETPLPGPQPDVSIVTTAPGGTVATAPVVTEPQEAAERAGAEAPSSPPPGSDDAEDRRRDGPEQGL